MANYVDENNICTVITCSSVRFPKSDNNVPSNSKVEYSV